MRTDHRPFCLLADASIRDAIALIDSTHKQFAIVVDSEQKLLGTLTDGDIRRSLLSGKGLTDSVLCAVNATCIFAPAHVSDKEAALLCEASSIRQLPLIDKNGRVVGLFLYDERMAKRPNPILIMAGGKGTRLLPLTEHVPKPMLPVGERPMLELIIEKCVVQGFNDILISIGYLGRVIQDYFGNGERFSARIRYIHETKPLGTAGALSLMRPWQHPLIVLNADVLCRVNFSALLSYHLDHACKATMVVSKHSFQLPYGEVQTDQGTITALKEKPIKTYFINAGIYVLSPDVLKLVYPGQSLEMTELFGRMLTARWPIAAFPLWENWMDLGQHKDLNLAQKNIEDFR